MLTTASGRQMLVDVEASTFLDARGRATSCSLLVLHDVTDASQVRVSRKEMLRQLREAQHAAGTGSWEWEVGTGRITWSDELMELFGVDAATFQPSLPAYLDRVHEDDREMVMGIIDDMLVSRQAAEFLHRIQSPEGGSPRWLECRAVVIPDSFTGEPARVVGTAVDATERVEAGTSHEVDVRVLQREREATRRIKELEALKRTLLASISHELRTPLTSILGFAMTLQQRPGLTPSERQLATESIVQQASRLSALLDDLLDLERMRRGTRDPDRHRANLSRVAHEVVRGHRPEAQARVRIHGASSVMGNVDVAKVERIMEILVDNALLNSPPESPVQLTVKRSRGCLCIVVEDRGPGVPDPLKAVIFEPFERHLDAPPTGGLGLGLAIVGTYTRLHGGRTWVEDRPGGGARFVVELPDQRQRRRRAQDRGGSE